MCHYKPLLICLLVFALLLALPHPVRTNAPEVPVESMPLRLAPGLLLAQGEDGTLGYVRATDLGEPQPKTPEEAVALMAERKASGYTGRYINLYAPDGVTVIGRFHVGWSHSTN